MAELISEKFSQWEKECEIRWNRLKEAEEELNRYFIGEYGIGDELDPYVADRDVTVRKADLSREIRSLISYAVGCIFGRYSLDRDGLCYAGGTWNDDIYRTIIPVSENILSISELSCHVCEFVEKVYGSETLDENLRFIASALGGDGEPMEIIEKYLLKEFFPDHCKIYHKRPIYWMFDSGRKCHLKALCYMHRWNGDIPSILSDKYVSPRIADIKQQLRQTADELKTAQSTDKPRLKRRIQKFEGQIEELTAFSCKLTAHHEDIDLDDGVKVNYEKFSDVLEKIK